MKDAATITGEAHEIRDQLRIVQETVLLLDRSKSELTDLPGVLLEGVRAMATIPEIKVHFSIQHADIPS